ncbi:hypothetical protein, partial [Candidatus Accumulibacter vicinus]
MISVRWLFGRSTRVKRLVIGKGWRSLTLWEIWRRSGTRFDPSRFLGTVHRAANWTPIGLAQEDRADFQEGGFHGTEVARDFLQVAITRIDLLRIHGKFVLRRTSRFGVA